jgi:hypothetical protein
MVQVDEYKWAKAVLVVTTARKATRFNVKQSTIVRELDDNQADSVRRVQHAVEEGRKNSKIREYGDSISIASGHIPLFLRRLGGDSARASKDWAEYRKKSINHQLKAVEIVQEIMRNCDTVQQKQVIDHLEKISKKVLQTNKNEEEEEEE